MVTAAKYQPANLYGEIADLIQGVLYMFTMEGHVAIVTGGAMGIGRAYTELLLSRKYKVCIADINEAKLVETIQELRQNQPGCDVIQQKCDVSDDEQLKKLFENTLSKFGRLDVVINNAGIMDESREQQVLAINLIATLHSTKLALEHLSTSKGGRGGLIVNIGSTAGFQPITIVPVYSATKHAVIGYTRSIGATSLGMHGVRINCICPSSTDTKIVTDMEEQYLYGPKGTLEATKEVVANTNLLSPKTVAECLEPFLDDVTLSGAVILCTTDNPRAILKLPETEQDIEAFYVR